jgi:hypothetical protein
LSFGEGICEDPVILYDLWRQAAEAPMFKIVAVVFIGILANIGFFDLGQEAYTLRALLLGIGALLDYGRKRTAG